MSKIVNRDLDQSQRKIQITGKIAPTVTGGSYRIGVVPFAAQCLAGWEAAYGLSGAPTAKINVHRFIAGTGATIITGLFNVNSPSAFGTSGLFGHSLIGGTSFLLLPDDVLFYETGGANTAIAETTVSVVIQALQDVVTQFGVPNVEI